MAASACPVRKTAVKSRPGTPPWAKKGNGRSDSPPGDEVILSHVNITKPKDLDAPQIHAITVEETSGNSDVAVVATGALNGSSVLMQGPSRNSMDPSTTDGELRCADGSTNTTSVQAPTTTTTVHPIDLDDASHPCEAPPAHAQSDLDVGSIITKTAATVVSQPVAPHVVATNGSSGATTLIEGEQLDERPVSVSSAVGHQNQNNSNSVPGNDVATARDEEKTKAKEALSKLLAAKQKELLRLQLQAKAQRLEQLRGRVRDSKQQSRPTQEASTDATSVDVDLPAPSAVLLSNGAASSRSHSSSIDSIHHSNSRKMSAPGDIPSPASKRTPKVVLTHAPGKPPVPAPRAELVPRVLSPKTQSTVAPSPAQPLNTLALKRWVQHRKEQQAIALDVDTHEDKIKEQRQRLAEALAKKRQLSTHRDDASVASDASSVSIKKRNVVSWTSAASGGREVEDGVIVLDSQVDATVTDKVARAGTNNDASKIASSTDQPGADYVVSP